MTAGTASSDLKDITASITNFTAQTSTDTHKYALTFSTHSRHYDSAVAIFLKDSLSTEMSVYSLYTS